MKRYLVLLALLGLLAVPVYAAEEDGIPPEDWTDCNCGNDDTSYGEEIEGAVHSGHFYWKLHEDRYAIIVATDYEIVDLEDWPEVLYVPAEIDGYPVKELASGAFTKTCGPVVLPEGLTTIREDVFGYSSSVSSLTIPSTVTLIEDGALSWRDNSYKRPQELIVAEESQHYQVRDGMLLSADGKDLFFRPQGENDVEIFIPEGVETIHSYAVKCTYSVTQRIILPDSLVTIMPHAFCRWSPPKYGWVDIPASVQFIGENTFFHPYYYYDNVNIVLYEDKGRFIFHGVPATVEDDAVNVSYVSFSFPFLSNKNQLYTFADNEHFQTFLALLRSGCRDTDILAEQALQQITLDKPYPKSFPHMKSFCEVSHERCYTVEVLHTIPFSSVLYLLPAGAVVLAGGGRYWRRRRKSAG